MRRWQRLVLRLVHRIWFRAGLFSLAAVALALVAAWVGPFIPYDLGVSIGAKAVDHILDILASSMLAVTTFAMGAMASVFIAAITISSPRAIALLIEDSRAQNALSTFLGGFLFAIVGICALSTGYYGETGRVVLFGGAILVIIVIAVTLLRFIQLLSNFGQMDDTIERVERVATAAVRDITRAIAVVPEAAMPPAGATAIVAGTFGYVAHVDLPGLTRCAADGGPVTVAAMPGAFVTPDRALAWAAAGGDGDAVRACFSVERTRSFDQDPRFGLVVLGEIAARALSPAVNDPGTAIAVIDAGTRVIAALMARDDDPDAAPGVILPRLALGDLLEDVFRPIARDGAATVEVGIRLHRAIAGLTGIRADARPVLTQAADDALARAASALPHPDDLAAVRAAHAHGWRALADRASPA